MRIHLPKTMSSTVAFPIVGFLLIATNASALASEIDPSSAVRGSLGASLDDLSLGNHFGTVSFLLNGGFALLCCAIVWFVVARRRQNRKPFMESAKELRGSAKLAATTGEHFLR
jgi:hypothetical protein